MTPYPKRTCAGCKQSFSPKYSYERWCWPCWRARRILEENQAKNLENAFDQLWSDFSEARCEIWSLKREVQQLTAANLSLSLRLLEAQARKNPTESDLAAQLKRQMPRLLQLVHPDRNNNSPASNELTAWLLDVRRTLS